MSNVIELSNRLKNEATAWASNSEPSVNNYKGWIFDWYQMEVAQDSISGAKFGPTIKESVDWLVARDEDLHKEACEYEEYDGSYGLPMGYCSFGWFLSSDPDTLTLWYETTSGTVLTHTSNGKEQCYQVFLPEHREGGKHNLELDYAKAGRTLDQRNRWNNSHCLGDDKIPDYAEWAEWHNTHMVPLGYQSMITGEQLRLDIKIDNALGHVHGDWSEKYGIGKNLSAMLGYTQKGTFFSSEPRNGTILKGQAALEEAEKVLDELCLAVKAWELLIADLKESSADQVPSPVLEEYGSDYEPGEG